VIITQETYQAVMDDLKKLLIDVVDLVKQRDDLLFALNRLYIACPTALECRHFHHSKEERHSYLEPCGPADEYIEALKNARDVIYLARKGG
jgi:ferredoxin-thioredoxin reductase catalytic subunit